MGLDARCQAVWGERSGGGRLQFEGEYLLFRGPFRVKIPVNEMLDARAESGWLVVAWGGEEIRFELGDAAARWADKIRNPPSLLDKLGVKAGTKVWVVGGFEPEFLAGLEQRGAVCSESGWEVVFLRVETPGELDRVPPKAAVVWTIYPKGRKDLTEGMLRAHCRGLGYKDTKVARFSTTHTALRWNCQALSRSFPERS